MNIQLLCHLHHFFLQTHPKTSLLRHDRIGQLSPIGISLPPAANRTPLYPLPTALWSILCRPVLGESRQHGMAQRISSKGRNKSEDAKATSEKKSIGKEDTRDEAGEETTEQLDNQGTVDQDYYAVSMR